MKKEIIIYSLAVGINRGAMFIYMPILAHALSLADFGQFNYVQILMQVISPLLCLNIAAGIAREGADDVFKGQYLYRKFATPVTLITVLLGLLAFAGGFVSGWGFTVAFVVMLAGFEALHNMLLAILRIQNNHLTYAAFTITKTAGLLLIYIVALNWFHPTLTEIILLQIAWATLIYALFHFTVTRNFSPVVVNNLKAVLHFSVLMLPHGISLWLLNASSRITVKKMLNDELLGVFSISYTLALVLMIINSGISIIMPQNFIRNYGHWINQKVRIKFLVLYTLGTGIVFALLLSGMAIDRYYLHILKIGHYKIADSFSTLFSGFYLLGIYYYFSNILFYHKKSGKISFITFCAAIVNIPLNFILIRYWSIQGAAAANLLSYAFYLGLMVYHARKTDANLKLAVSDLVIPIAATGLFLVTGHLLTTFI